MPRAFTAADVVQHDTGSASAVTTDVTASLPSGATEGRGGLIIIGGAAIIDPPQQWHSAVPFGPVPANPQAAILVRPDLPAGDQSWGFTHLAGTTTSWAWIAEEWTNLSFAPMVTTPGTGSGAAGASSVSTGSTGSFSGLYVAGIAAVLILASGNPAGQVAWSSISASWSNSFVETDVVSAGVGTGGATLDMQLRVARRYGVPADSGPWDTTCTFTGTMTGKTPYAGITVLRAENLLGDI